MFGRRRFLDGELQSTQQPAQLRSTEAHFRHGECRLDLGTDAGLSDLPDHRPERGEIETVNLQILEQPHGICFGDDPSGLPYKVRRMKWL